MHSVVETAHRFGLSGNIPSYLPVALGSVEATLSAAGRGLRSFPNDGVRITPHLVRKVTNADGMTLSEDSADVHESISASTARTMMIFSRKSPAPARHQPPPLSIIPSGVKPAPPATTPTPGSSASPPRHLRRLGRLR